MDEMEMTDQMKDTLKWLVGGPYAWRLARRRHANSLVALRTRGLAMDVMSETGVRRWYPTNSGVAAAEAEREERDD